MPFRGAKNNEVFGRVSMANKAPSCPFMFPCHGGIERFFRHPMYKIPKELKGYYILVYIYPSSSSRHSSGIHFNQLKIKENKLKFQLWNTSCLVFQQAHLIIKNLGHFKAIEEPVNDRRIADACDLRNPLFAIGLSRGRRRQRRQVVRIQK